MKGIAISAGKVALIDDDDLSLVSQFTWHWVKPRWGRGSGYAATIIRKSGMKWKDPGARQRIFMHNLIMPPDPGLEVDHIDHNGLNNQKSNFRFATRQQQTVNKVRQIDSVNLYRGVNRRVHNGGRVTWVARIGYSHGHMYLGNFNSAESAALAYNRAAVKLFGEFAVLNKVA